MDERANRALRQPLAGIVGQTVMDQSGVSIGVVVGRVVRGDAVDLLVRRRRMFQRSMYLRLRGDAISMSGRTFVHCPDAARRRTAPAVIRLVADAQSSRGDAA